MLTPRASTSASGPAQPVPDTLIMFSASGSRSRWIAGALLICALIWFAGLEYRGLFMPDEGRYADIAREMLNSNDWVTPRLNGIKYLEKPPLQYWATAGAFAAFRLSSGTPWILIALTVAGCWGYFIGGQFLTLDMGLTFFLTAALVGF